MRRPIFLIALFAALAILAAAPEVQGDKPTCKRCEVRPAVWSWKANGYALAADGAAAQKLAEERAFADACAASSQHLAARKLQCPAGCEAAGEPTERCEHDGKPKCMSGTYESSKGMWSHACTKVHQHLAGKGEQPCTEEHARTTPGWAMCDVPVKAHKTLACADPSCT